MFLGLAEGVVRFCDGGGGDVTDPGIWLDVDHGCGYRWAEKTTKWQ